MTQDARNHILQQFDHLSPQLQAAARFVVDHPNDVLIRSMRSVAELAGVPPSTLVRLARQLDYDGWPALKDGFAHSMGLDGPQGYADRAQRLSNQAHTHTLADELFDAHGANLERTRQHSASLLVPLAQCLQSANQVYVAGFRASYPLAFALLYGYRLFRDSVQSLDAHAHNLEMQLRPLGAEDVLVAISFAPYSRECLEVAHIAKERGARIVALTDSEASPLARMADHAALFAVDSPSFFPSVAAGMALVEALLEQLVALGDAQLPQRIQKAESALVDGGAYVQGRQALKAFRHR
ncbi:MurR/RpiR family transcriptional regulator [Comamonas sp. GB3 AK4-5]|uniref:MurR/RpiR family transcriptional regulator n=1 Tax=Comamonas sp. GB3 AK4-5 TaxID=3231487 RepID=UPI00351E8497